MGKVVTTALRCTVDVCPRNIDIVSRKCVYLKCPYLEIQNIS